MGISRRGDGAEPGLLDFPLAAVDGASARGVDPRGDERCEFGATIFASRRPAVGDTVCKEVIWTADKVLWENIMWNSGHDAYLESRVMTADPMELVNLLYQACTQAVREARLHLAEGRIAERSRQINKACEIVIELATALDHQRGGEISQRLALLYDYIQQRLLEANMQQSDAPLADVLGLLSTLGEAWAGIRKPEEKREATAVAESPWSQPGAQEAQYALQGWSL
jgi:flagellar protein FliS